MNRNKRIIKNTLFMYFRMFLILIVSLYTSRVVLRVLGVEDFGIYHVVGSIVSMFTFLNVVMSGALQRFISYDLGRNEISSAVKSYCTGLNCQIIISFILFILAETLGLWYINNKIVVPDDRVYATLIVFQISVATFLLNFFKIPLHSLLLSYEKMDFYAVIGILEAILKLMIVFLISVLSKDKLILYALLLFITALICFAITLIYCKIKFPEYKYRFEIDIPRFKKLFSFTGWSFVGGSSVVFVQQGNNIIMNLFSGLVANASYGIATQVRTAVYSFVSSFQSAFQPQIFKQYANREYKSLQNLIDRTSIYSYYLLLIISLPLILNIEWVLRLWLGEVPLYAGLFCTLFLINSLVDSCQSPLWMLINATGEIRNYSIFSSVILLLCLPIGYILLRAGYSPSWIIIAQIVLNVLTAVYRVVHIKLSVSCFSISNYIREVIFKIFYITCISFFISIGIHYGLNIKQFPLLSIFLLAISTFSIVFFFGMDYDERRFIIDIVIKKIKL